MMDLIPVHNLTDEPNPRTGLGVPRILAIFGQRLAPGQSSQVEKDRLKFHPELLQLEEGGAVAFGPLPAWYVTLKRKKKSGRRRWGSGNVEKARALAKLNTTIVEEFHEVLSTPSPIRELLPPMPVEDRPGDYSQMTKTQLREAAVSLDLSDEGTKTELLERLQAFQELSQQEGDGGE